MNVIFDLRFHKSLDKLKVDSVKNEVIKFIEQVESADSLKDLSSIKKLKGFKSFYRYSFDVYRIGFELEKQNTVRLIKVMHRKDIYKKFP
jgi:mRNA interferase RelE/StbE